MLRCVASDFLIDFALNSSKQYLPPDRYLLSTPQMTDRICMTLGGRVSEEIFFGPENITTGAQDDLQKITRMAFEACANYGMNDVIGPVSYGGDRGAKESWTKPFSERTAEMLDTEVRRMITLVAFLLLHTIVQT
jgi:AFG3 family protein